MLKRRKRDKMGVREPEQIRSWGHLAWVRGHECLLASKGWHKCDGKMEAHHIRVGNLAGLGLKPGDEHTVPLCSYAHRIVHDLGHESFEQSYGLKLEQIAADLWRRSPHRLKYERKQERSA